MNPRLFGGRPGSGRRNGDPQGIRNRREISPVFSKVCAQLLNQEWDSLKNPVWLRGNGPPRKCNFLESVPIRNSFRGLDGRLMPSSGNAANFDPESPSQTLHPAGSQPRLPGLVGQGNCPSRNNAGLGPSRKDRAPIPRSSWQANHTQNHVHTSALCVVDTRGAAVTRAVLGRGGCADNRPRAKCRAPEATEAGNQMREVVPPPQQDVSTNRLNRIRQGQVDTTGIE